MIFTLLRAMRPKQWTKNVFFFAALVFDHKLLEPTFFLPALAGFALLCLTSGTVYLINDLVDLEKDRLHPLKRHRPLASGRLSKSVALEAAVAFVVIGQPLGYLLHPSFGLILSAYLLLQLAYSFWLKHVVLIDVLAIATGFVLRVAAGVAMVDVARFSPWLYVCMTFLALFLGLGKRRHELNLLKTDANNHRAILDQYSIALLDQLITIVVAGTIIAYAFYTFSAEGLPENHLMMLTIAFVVYAHFRYLYLIHVRGEGGAPEEILLGDRPFILNALAWGASVIAIFYIL